MISSKDTDNLCDSLDRVAKAITPEALPGKDESGGTVRSLTEAVMGITSGLYAIASALENLAFEVQQHGNKE